MSDLRDLAGSLWYERCVERACRYPARSWRHAFWWSLRFELDAEGIQRWARDPEGAVDEWVSYFHFKLTQLGG